MPIGLIVGIVVVLVILVGMVYVGRRENTGEDPLEKRLIEYGDRPEPTSLAEIESSLSFRDRVMVPLFKGMANLVTRFTPEQQIEATRRQLELAGKAQTTDPRVFFGQRLMMTILMGGGAFAVFHILSQQSLWLPLTVVGAALGYYLPALQLRGQVSRRQQGIVRDLPDALDLMTICVEAGLTFDMAMSKVYEKWDNDLALSFGRVLA